MTYPQRRRVVVTGIGAVTPLGITFVQTWQQLCLGHCGVTSLSNAFHHQNYTSTQQLDQDLSSLQSLSCQVAAAVPKEYLSLQAVNSSRNTSRVVQFALSATAEAIQSANLTNWWGNENEHDSLQHTNHGMKGDTHFQSFDRRRQRTGVSIGTGMSGVRDLVHAVRTLDEGDGNHIRKISPYLVPTILGNSASSRIAIQHGLRGPNVSATTACAAGSHAIGDAVRYIQSNMADIMMAGGGEACLDPISLIGFHRLRALSTKYNDTPKVASRPFDTQRDGFVMGEGACVLILEEMEHAKQRFHGIPPSLRIPSQQEENKENTNVDSIQDQPYWIEVCGYGATGDAHHITSPDPTGRGAIEAMQQSIHEAWTMNSEEGSSNTLNVDYVNAHATSTPVGDEIEVRAIQQTLRRMNANTTGTTTMMDGNKNTPRRTFVSSTKGATGHLLGAAGAIEAAFTIQSLVEQKIIPTLNLEHVLSINDDVSSSSTTANHHDLIFVQGKEAMSCPPDGELNIAMSNSFGFGGTNSSLTFRRTRD